MSEASPKNQLADVYDLLGEARILVMRLDGTAETPGIIRSTEETCRLVGETAEVLSQICNRLRIAKNLSQEISELPDRLVSTADSRQFRESIRATLADEHEKVLEAGREAAINLVSANLEEQMCAALEAAERRVYGDTLIIQKTLLIQNEEFTAEIVRLNGVIAEMDKQKVDAAKELADLAEDFGKRLMRIYTTRLVPVSVVSLVCGAALSLTPVFPMLLDMIVRR